MGNRVIAIVPSAGTGKRFGSSEKKTFVSFDGIPLIVHALKRLQYEKSVSEIIPVLGQEDIGRGHDLFQEHGLNKIRRIAPGGRERQDSIYNALKLIEEDCLVLIHDGVRPIIPEGTVDALLKWLEDFDGAVPAIPVKDTLKEVTENELVRSTINRDIIRAIQTPQAFSLKVIKRAYDLAQEEGFHATDDAALVEKMGGKIKVIPGSPHNIKVTTPEDLEIIKFLLLKKSATAN